LHRNSLFRIEVDGQDGLIASKRRNRLTYKNNVGAANCPRHLSGLCIE